MWKSCLEGLVLGLSLAIMLGPAFFSLLQTSLERGFKTAATLAFGVFCSDSFLVGISFLGASRLFEYSIAKYVVGFVGGGVLIGIGLYTYLKKIEPEKGFQLGTDSIKVPTRWTSFVKGFFMNMANPGIWLYWIFWVGVISARYTEEGQVSIPEVVAFFGTALLVVLATDLLKAFIAHQLKTLITPKVIGIVNKVVGVLLILFGLYLIFGLIFDFNSILNGMN